MEILYLLIPLALVLVVLIGGAFLWAARAGQFDDLEGPAHRIIMDDDEAETPRDSTTVEQPEDGKSGGDRT